ncbi:MAG: 1-acyl-sn-glycerol-3-phosphate acyltransferase [Raineya sp.]|jgi:1-acyl-sn-glycerol-3-phosphate acyltransferase|nr:1-acyl-sn-glycerol-3-phosphate acyltransferase [Raineya sp.]
MLYFILRPIVQIALKVFFKRLQVHQKYLLNIEEPIIYVANHPNTFMDPIILAALSKKKVHFLSNGSVFNRFTRPIFKFFNMIPIYRKTDKSDKPISQAELNKMSFQKCYDFLAQKGTLLIFPEGTSIIERRLREIKTGTARIALGAEYENKFTLGLKIIPIGINYSDADKFRSEVLVNIGEPILLSKYQHIYNSENFEAVETLTKEIEDEISKLIIVTENEEQDILISNIEKIYKNTLFEEFDLPEKKYDEFVVVKEIVKGVKYFEQKNSQYFKNLRIQTDNYLENLSVLGLSDEIFQRSHKKSILGYFIGSILLLILGFPFYVAGLIGNYIPYILPSKIARMISSDITFKAPLMMISGIFVFPVAYGISFYLVWYLSQSIEWALATLGLLPLLGYFVLWYIAIWEKFKINWQSVRLFYKKPSLLNNLIEQRKAIFKELKALKEEYLKKL